MKRKYLDIIYLLSMYIPTLLLIMSKYSDLNINFINIATLILTIGVGIITLDMIFKYSKNKQNK